MSNMLGVNVNTSAIQSVQASCQLTVSHIPVSSNKLYDIPVEKHKSSLDQRVKNKLLMQRKTVYDSCSS